MMFHKDDLTDQEFVAIKGLTVAEYHPLPNGEGPPTAIHLVIEIEGVPLPLVMRFNEPSSIDELIVALIAHRKAVFGDLKK